jgi:hypothetical protein
MVNHGRLDPRVLNVEQNPTKHGDEQGEFHDA